MNLFKVKYMFKKRAQGLGIRFIILAILSLVILVVLIAIFTGRLSNFIDFVKSTNSCGDICNTNDKSGGRTSPDQGYEILIGARDSDGNQCYCKT